MHRDSGRDWKTVISALVTRVEFNDEVMEEFRSLRRDDFLASHTRCRCNKSVSGKVSARVYREWGWVAGWSPR